MSAPRSRREIETALDGVGDDSGRPKPSAASDTLSLSIEWRDADPEQRPNGMSWEVDRDAGTATLAYDLWSAQRETFDLLSSAGDPSLDRDLDLAAFLGGFGSGKSVFGARWLVATALANPGSKFLALGVDFQKARDTTFPKLFAALPGDRTTVLTSAFNGPESSPIVADYNRRSRRLTLVNDAVIILGSASEASRYAGAEFGGIWCDEPAFYSDLHQLTEMLISRLRSAAGPQVMTWTTTGNGYNAAWEILEKQRDADGEPLGIEIETVRASVLENPYLDDAEKERFRRKFEDTDREDQALHGGFAAAEGLVYSRFARETHVIKHANAVDLVDGPKRTYGYDAGWRDPRVLVEIGETAAGQLVVLDEWRAEESHVEDAIAWLDRHDKPRGTVYCEHEPADIEKFEKAGWNAEKAEKSIDAGIAEVRSRLETDESGRPGLLVSERCDHLIREMFGYQADEVGTAVAEDHALDALRYAVFTPVASSTLRRVTRIGTPDQLAERFGLAASTAAETVSETTEAATDETKRRLKGFRQSLGEIRRSADGRRIVRRRAGSMRAHSGRGRSESDRERKKRAEKEKERYWADDRNGRKS